MTTDVATTAASSLAITAGQRTWSDAQLAALKQLGVHDAPAGDLAVFWHVCARTGLDPFARQIHLVARQGRYTIQTGIDGLRLVARRVADTAGETLGYADTLWCGQDGAWRDVWLSPDPPAAAKVTVLRGGQPYPAVALFEEYAGRTKEGALNHFWRTMPAGMLAKCAEALALRRAFPLDLSGVHSEDEMHTTSSPGAGEAQRGQGQGQPGPGPAEFARALQAINTAGSVAELNAAVKAIPDGLPPVQVDYLRAAWTSRNEALKPAPDTAEPVEPEVVEPVSDAPGTSGRAGMVTEAQIRKLNAQVTHLERIEGATLPREVRRELILTAAGVTGVESASELTSAQASRAIDALDAEIAARMADPPAGEVIDAEVVDAPSDGESGVQ